MIGREREHERMICMAVLAFLDDTTKDASMQDGYHKDDRSIWAAHVLI
jgi:hypothetical protein